MTLIDTHSHLYLPAFDTDRSATIDRADREGVQHVLLPAIDSETHDRMLDTERAFPARCRAMMGLHPCSVKANYREELRCVQDHWSARDFIALGEIGLDFYWDRTFSEQQYEAFHQQIEWALQRDRPIVIHSREAVDACIEVVRHHQKGSLRGVFHCFSGTLEQARQIIELGFYLGIGGVLTFRNSGLDRVLGSLTLDRILLETDAPYLAPVPHRGQRNEPAYLRLVLEKLASVMGVDSAVVADRTTVNARALFGPALG